MLYHHILPSSLLNNLSILILLSFLLESLALKLYLPLHFITRSDVLHLIHTLVIHLCFCEIFLHVVLIKQLGMLELDVQVNASERSVYLLAVALIVAWSCFFLIKVRHQYYY